MTYKTLTYGIKDNIARLEISSPPSNTMSLKFFDELLFVCENEIIKNDFKALIISSKGRHFSSGADVKELSALIKKDNSNIVPDEMKNNLKAIHLLYNLKKPKIALLKGICYGSGFEIALTANYRFAQKNTIISLPEVSFNLMPGLGGVSTLVNLIGGAKALELSLTGKTTNVYEALELGIIDDIVEKQELENYAVNFINNGIKQLMN